MNSRAYALVSATIFALVALAHVARLLHRAQVQLGHFHVPLVLSWVGLIAAAAMSAWGFRSARR